MEIGRKITCDTTCCESSENSESFASFSEDMDMCINVGILYVHRGPKNQRFLVQHKCMYGNFIVPNEDDQRLKGLGQF